MSYITLPENQFCDEVKVSTKIRWKESHLSGDEWRISAVVEFFRKGFLVHKSSWRNVEIAMIHAWSDFVLKGESGKLSEKRTDWEQVKCFQEGCSNDAVWKLTLKKYYCVGGGNCGQEKYKDNSLIGKSYRLFCNKHKHRGDCDIEDCDSNYDVAHISEQNV